jgi:hypothetical protein
VVVCYVSACAARDLIDDFHVFHPLLNYCGAQLNYY